jgi:hypothetical protein
MIEGYSHHDGHADLMRERLDGSAGRTTDRPQSQADPRRANRVSQNRIRTR